MEQYRRIGLGYCGSVWATQTAGSDGRDEKTATKREDGGPGRSLLNDFNIQRQLIAAYDACPDLQEFCIPRSHKYMAAHSDEAQAMLPHLPVGYTASNSMVSERIPPMGEAVCNLLIDKYFDVDPALKVDADTHYCLVRPYLGRRKRMTHKPRHFSLRNFPLHANQMEELGLPTKEYARIMAAALAFMLWGAGIDAGDVEYVLAPARETATERQRVSTVPFGEHSLWLLDFDCCKRLESGEAGLKQAARAFWRNDPFYPRPGQEGHEDRELWREFKAAFLAASEDITKTKTKARGTDPSLPPLFVDLLERQKADAGDKWPYARA